MARLLGHRQTKGAATDKPDLLPPRYIPTLPDLHLKDRYPVGHYRGAHGHQMFQG
jgi:hypothetical protein